MHVSLPSLIPPQLGQIRDSNLMTIEGVVGFYFTCMSGIAGILPRVSHVSFFYLNFTRYEYETHCSHGMLSFSRMISLIKQHSKNNTYVLPFSTNHHLERRFQMIKS